MKSSIHPQFYPNATVVCACGHSFTAGSTVKEMRTEVCSSCHPFYTGKQHLVDAAGAVDKFRKRSAAAKQIKAAVQPKKERKARVKK